MNRLFINTANEELYVVLESKGKLFHKSLSSRMHHNETMLPIVDELLKENCLDILDINELGVVIGPGSFTGIRVGISTIKAFRDALNVKAKGVNNLDLLYSLASSQNADIETVAILGSRDSYFVAKLINGVVYKYERNLTLGELLNVAGGKKVGMYTFDENVSPYVVRIEDSVVMQCLDESSDYGLVPVYYQLSQAESEKLKRGEIVISKATKSNLDKIIDIENSSIICNHLSREDISASLNSGDYEVYIARINNEVAGYIILQLTDELNVESIAVKREYRNLGIGTRLLNEAVGFAKSKGMKCLSLEVSEKNITAYLLYQKYGFTTRRVRKNYYEDLSNAIEMVYSIL